MSEHDRTRRLGTAIIAALTLTFAASGAAMAQSAPAPAATPAGATNPGPPSPVTSGGNQGNPGGGSQGATPHRASATPFTPFAPVIDLQVVNTEPGEANIFAPTSIVKHTNSQLADFYQNLDVGGTIRIPFTRTLGFSFDRIVGGLIDQPLSRYETNGVPGYSAVTRDVILQYRLTDAISRQLTAEVGLSFRHRTESGGFFGPPSGVSDNPYPGNASTEHHYGYLALAYTTKPMVEFLHASFTFREAFDAQNIDHTVASAGCTAGILAGTTAITATPNYGYGARCAAVGVLDEQPGKTRWYQTTQTAGIIVPVDPRHGTTFSFLETWGALNFYENYATPFRYTSQPTFLLTKKFNNWFSLALDHKDLHQTLQGTPLPYPNAVNPESWDVIGTFHLDTGSMFH